MKKLIVSLFTLCLFLMAAPEAGAQVTVGWRLGMSSTDVTACS